MLIVIAVPGVKAAVEAAAGDARRICPPEPPKLLNAAIRTLPPLRKLPEGAAVEIVPVLVEKLMLPPVELAKPLKVIGPAGLPIPDVPENGPTLLLVGPVGEGLKAAPQLR